VNTRRRILSVPELIAMNENGSKATCQKVSY